MKFSLFSTWTCDEEKKRIDSREKRENDRLSLDDVLFEFLFRKERKMICSSIDVMSCVELNDVALEMLYRRR